MSGPLLYAVLPRPAHPTRDGLAIRNYYLLAALAESFRVRAFVLMPPHLEEEPAEYPSGVDVERVGQSPRWWRRLVAGAGAIVGGAYSPRLYASRALRERVARGAAREKPAWVVAQSYHVAPAALGSGCASWVDFHNVDSGIWRRVAETEESPAARRFASRQGPRLEDFERGILEAATGVSCVSDRDAAELRRLEPRAVPLVVPNGVDLARYTPRQPPSQDGRVFFVGDLTWAPNVSGIRWFRREVWPEVRRRVPGARAEILGRGGERLDDGADGLTFLGAGGDTRPFWRNAAVAIVPLFSGGGTRLKILEAAASGVPVVSTSVGAEGLSFAADEILIRDDAAGFAEAIAGLLGDPAAGQLQAARARSRVEREYDWKSIGARFARELARRAEAAD